METTTPVSQRPPTGVQKRRKPSGETSHVCPFCGRAFKRSEHKERHVRTHTKEKPFVCHCGSAFTRRDLLTRHQRIATHEKLQDAYNNPKSEQSGVLAPASVAGTDLTSPISPTDMSVNGWDQHSQSNPTYVNGNATDEYQIMSHHQPQQPMFHHDYYQSQAAQELPVGYGDFEGLPHFDDNGLPVGWDANTYFQPHDTGETYVDPQLQETISISI